MRYIYVSNKGSKPLNIGMNQAKRVAHYADERDRALVVKSLGGGLPTESRHHQELVQRRHRYYREIEMKATEFVPHFAHTSGSGPRECARRLGSASDGEVNGNS
jgi:hypothetical protein